MTGLITANFAHARTHVRTSGPTPSDSNLNLCLTLLPPFSSLFLLFQPTGDVIYLCHGQGHLPISKCHWSKHPCPLLLIIPPRSSASFSRSSYFSCLTQIGVANLHGAELMNHRRKSQRIGRRDAARPGHFRPLSQNCQGNPTLSALYCHITLSHKQWNKEIEAEVEYEWRMRWMEGGACTTVRWAPYQGGVLHRGN